MPRTPAEREPWILVRQCSSLCSLEFLAFTYSFVCALVCCNDSTARFCAFAGVCMLFALAELVRGLEDGEYTVQLAVGQCPETCIHYVTAEQQDLLTDMLQG